MSNNPIDPLQALSAALAAPSDSKEQSVLLDALRENLEAFPNPIPILCATLISTVSGAGESLLKRWVLDLMHFALCRSSLSLEARTQLAAQSLDVLTKLLDDTNTASLKVIIQCFAAVYPLLFRILCTNRSSRQQWETLSQAKSRILSLIWMPDTTSGIKLCAVKFMQKVILAQTRGISDPRLQNKNDPNLSFCPADHPFIPVANLESEGIKLIEGIITLLYTSQSPDVVSAIINSWVTLAKQRPSQTHIVISALASWTPAALTGSSYSTIKSVEKAIRILLVHISRTPQGSPFAHQINEALVQQTARMEQALQIERNRQAAAAAEASRQRSISTLTQEASDAERAQTEHPSADIAAALENFDFASLPVDLVIELIVANLRSISQDALQDAVQAYRQLHGIGAPASVGSSAVGPPTAATSLVKEEPVDPLQMDIDEDEIDFEPDALEMSEDVVAGHDLETVAEMDIDVALQLRDFKLPPPKELSGEEQLRAVKSFMSRIWDGAGQLEFPQENIIDNQLPNDSSSPKELWMLLLVRMATRTYVSQMEESSEDGVKPSKADGDRSVSFFCVSRSQRIRETICDYIITDFPARARLAITWMNEEWYNDQLQEAHNGDQNENYVTWLNSLVSRYEPIMDARDRTFSRFLLDIPHVPSQMFEVLREMCVDPDRMQAGFTTLREFVIQRPPLRAEAIRILLELTTHPEKVTRGAAIITVKRWIPDVRPMSEIVRNFALQLLRRLQLRPAPEAKKVVEVNGINQDDMMEDGEMPQEEVVQTEYLPAELEIPAQKPQVLQHVELVFALCVKLPDLLDEIFDSYGQMDVSVQEAIQELITALIRSLGSSNGKLLTLLRNFPPGSQSLALRIITIFTETGRPSAPLVALVKSLITERDLDARFLIPIIAEMDKADIIRHLPRIIALLNGSQEMKDLVKNVFSAIVTTPPQTFGSVTSNLPRVRQSELLTPAELMVLLHEAEKDIGLKSCIEAISICFSMTDVFRSEILAVVMQQIVDEPTLPVLFLRTVIQAVTTYKSLVGFVSTTLLSRLITKKIWTNPPLWEGFIRCAKVIGPASFGALLQLPKEQLRDVVDKQPALRTGLKDYVLKKAGNKARQAGFLDLFGDDDRQTPTPQTSPAVVSTP